MIIISSNYSILNQVVVAPEVNKIIVLTKGILHGLKTEKANGGQIEQFDKQVLNLNEKMLKKMLQKTLFLTQ